jgi:CIC family chloride channel protein
VLDCFELRGTVYLAVVDGGGPNLGVVTEKYAHRRYIEESEKTHSQMFGES